MNFYLSDSSVPELAGLTAAQRGFVRRGALAQLRKAAPSARLLCALPAGIGAGLGFALGLFLADLVATYFWSLVIGVVCAAVGAGLGAVVAGHCLTKRLRPHFARFIDEHRDEVANVA